MSKRFWLALAVVMSFFVGYGSATVFAYPSGGMYGRGEWRGFFTNTLDTAGTDVLPAFSSYSGNSFPTDLNTADEFINFIIYTKLDIDGNGSGDAQERTGAAFIIHTMLGTPASSRSRPPTTSQLDDWKGRVRLAASEGRISWFYNYSYGINSYYQGVRGGGSPNDDAFFDDSGTSSSIVFKDDSGRIVYAIRRQCGNPVGNVTAIQPAFNMTGHTDLITPSGDGATAQPGDTVTFRHYVTNNGPSATNPTSIAWATEYMPSGTTITYGSGSPYADGQTQNVNNENYTIPSNAANGTQYCRRVGYDPINNAGGRMGRAPAKCVTVVVPSKLKASINVNPSTMNAGDSATFSPYISAENTGATVNGVTCTQTQTVYSPSGSVVSTTSIPCTDSSGNSSITVASGAAVPLASNSYNSSDSIAVGSRVCQTITITNPSAASYYNTYPGDTTSTACVTIAKQPYVQFLGSDIWAGGGFAALGSCTNNANIYTVTRSRSVADGTTPGSGVTYAAFALGRISNFGSGSLAYVGATGIGKALTFSNINSSNLGYYGASQHCINDYASVYQSATAMAPGVYNVGGSSGAWHVTGDVTLHGNMGSGLQQVYFVTGNVTIDSNITYAPTFNTAKTIPSLVVIATGNIYVSGGVQQLDGVYISRGTFYTCWPKVEPATVGTCNSKLTVNGAVSANALDLFRTAGAEGGTPAQQKDPAEVFNLGTEVYLNNALNSTSQTTITTNNVRELAPRF